MASLVAELVHVLGVLALNGIIFKSIKNNLDNSIEQAKQRKNFKFEVYQDGIRVEEHKISKCLSELAKQKVTKVQRWAQSLTGWFPSGIITIGTQLLANKACRHEYVSLETESNIITLEVNKSSDCLNQDCLWRNPSLKKELGKNCGKCDEKFSSVKEEQPILKMQIWTKNKENKELCNIQDRYPQQKRYWRRILKQYSIEDKTLRPLRIVNFLKLWNFMAEIYENVIINNPDKTFTKTAYDLFTSNCKSFARASLYFSSNNQQDCDQVIDSITGQFSDKPLNFMVEPVTFFAQKGVNSFTKWKYYKEEIQTLHNHTKILQTFEEDDEEEG